MTGAVSGGWWVGALCVRSTELELSLTSQMSAVFCTLMQCERSNLLFSESQL